MTFQIKRLMEGLMAALFFFAIATLVLTQGAAVKADTASTATTDSLVDLTTIAFFLGGAWGIISAMGLVPTPQEVYRGYRARN